MNGGPSDGQSRWGGNAPLRLLHPHDLRLHILQGILLLGDQPPEVSNKTELVTLLILQLQENRKKKKGFDAIRSAPAESAAEKPGNLEDFQGSLNPFHRVAKELFDLFGDLLVQGDAGARRLAEEADNSLRRGCVRYGGATTAE